MSEGPGGGGGAGEETRAAGEEVSAGGDEARAAGDEVFLCDLCGAPMLDRHCKLTCLRCGYQRDCSDP
jgi:hypothetical protein